MNQCSCTPKLIKVIIVWTLKAIWGEIRVLSFVHSPIQTSWLDLCSYEVTGGDCYFPAISCEITKIFAYVAYVCYICIIIFHLHRVSITFLILYPKSQVSISNTTQDILWKLSKVKKDKIWCLETIIVNSISTI